MSTSCCESANNKEEEVYVNHGRIRSSCENEIPNAYAHQIQSSSKNRPEKFMPYPIRRSSYRFRKTRRPSAGADVVASFLA